MAIILKAINLISANAEDGKIKHLRLLERMKLRATNMERNMRKSTHWIVQMFLNHQKYFIIIIDINLWHPSNFTVTHCMPQHIIWESLFPSHMDF